MGVFEMTVKRRRRWLLQSNNTSRVRFTVISNTPMLFRFYHTHNMYKRNWDGSCLVNLIYFALYISQIRNLLHCVDESRWNMSFKETRLGDGVADDVVVMLRPLWLHPAALWRHTVWIRTVTSHNAWLGYEYSLPSLNRPRRFTNLTPPPSKKWGVCDNEGNQPVTGGFPQRGSVNNISKILGRVYADGQRAIFAYLAMQSRCLSSRQSTLGYGLVVDTCTTSPNEPSIRTGFGEGSWPQGRY